MCIAKLIIANAVHVSKEADSGINVSLNKPISGTNAHNPVKKARNIKNRLLLDSLGIIGDP